MKHLRPILFLSVGALATPLQGQSHTSVTRGGPPSPAVRSQMGAAAVLERGIAAAGGWEALQGIRTITFDAAMERGYLGQNPTLDDDTPPLQPSRYSVTWDLEGDRLLADIFQPPNAPQPAARLVMGPDEHFLSFLGQNAIQEVPDRESPPWSWFLRDASVPPVFLREAAEHSAGLRYLGEGAAGGEPTQVISYPTSNGQERTLSFSQESGLLVLAETVVDHVQWGSTSEAVAFSDYGEAEGIMFPASVVATLGGEVLSRGQFTSPAFNAVEAGALSARPEGAQVVPAQMPLGAAAQLRTEELAPGIFQVMNVIPGYNLLFVDLPEGVVVIDALGGTGGARKVMEQVGEALPGKSISSVVVTHHHHDHTDGLLPFLKEGIPILAPPSNVPFVQEIASLPRTDPEFASLPEAQIHGVDDRLTVGEGPNRFELIDVGPNPHAQELLVAYFPEHRLLYVADVYGYIQGYTPPPLLLSFAAKLEELGLEVDRFATAHTTPATFQEYEAMVAAARAQGGGVDQRPESESHD